MLNQHGFIVAQLGARMHYAVPRILHEAGRLNGFYTDICANKGFLRILNVVPKKLRKGGFAKLLSRHPTGVPTRMSHSFPMLGLEYKRRLRAARTREDALRVHLWMGNAFCERVLKKAGRSWTGAYVFNSAGLQILEACRATNALGCLEQCSSPRLKELRLLREESERWHEWGSSLEVSNADVDYANVEKKEWATASRILCPSEFVRNGLIEEGADPAKIHLVPYGVDIPVGSRRWLEDGKRRTSRGNSPLRVLVAGQVCLQKGSQYVYEAAALLGSNALFRLVGSIAGVPEQVLRKLRLRLEFLGPMPRSAMTEQYDWADVFLLPSLCEGSATVTYEALAHGLPVICTPNTGSVVRDGGEGFIVPVRDAAAIAERIERLAHDVELRTQMAANARARAAEFTVAEYGRRLLAALPA
jgi:glycosyltransferase involved in cell wall biosynthesis